MSIAFYRVRYPIENDQNLYKFIVGYIVLHCMANAATIYTVDNGSMIPERVSVGMRQATRDLEAV